MTGVFAAIFDGGGGICLVHQDYGLRNWGLPGGGVERGESPLEALCREVREEAGYEVHVQDLVGVYSAPLASDQLMLCFTVAITGGDAWQPNDEISERRYFRRANLPVPMNSVQRQAVIDAFASARGIVRVLELHEQGAAP